MSQSNSPVPCLSGLCALVTFLSSCGEFVVHDATVDGEEPTLVACGVYANPGVLVKRHWPDDDDAPDAAGLGVIWEQAFAGAWRVEANVLFGEYAGVAEILVGGGVYVFDVGVGFAFEAWDAGALDVSPGGLVYVGVVVPIPGVSTFSIRHTWYRGDVRMGASDVDVSGCSVNASVHFSF